MLSENEDIQEQSGDAQNDCSQTVRLTIRRRKPGTRLDKYLRARFPRMSRTTLQRLIKEGGITVNGLPTKPSYEPAKGDLVEVLVPPPRPIDVVPECIPLDIIYEDDHLLAINKQTGIICHPAGPAQTGTLVNGLAYYAGSLSHGEDPFRPGIVHRLDKNTTGVMLVAKTDETHWRLALQFERRTLHKTYLAVVEGEMPLDADIIDQPLAANPLIKDRYIAATKVTRNLIAKDAVTHYQVADRFAGFTLVQMHPKTGRTHQLRVHMSSIGHPIMGDTLYGGHFVSEHDLTGAGSDDPLFRHQCLHAWKIEFTHPIREKPMMIEAPISPRLQSLIDLLREHRPGIPRRSHP